MRRIDFKLMFGALTVEVGEHDRCLLEGIDRGLEALHIDVCDVEAEVLLGLEACRREDDVGEECVEDLSAALDQLADLRLAVREMRARAATLSG